LSTKGKRDQNIICASSLKKKKKEENKKNKSLEQGMVDKGTKYYDSAIHEWHLPRI